MILTYFLRENRQKVLNDSIVCHVMSGAHDFYLTDIPNYVTLRILFQVIEWKLQPHSAAGEEMGFCFKGKLQILELQVGMNSVDFCPTENTDYLFSFFSIKIKNSGWKKALRTFIWYNIYLISISKYFKYWNKGLYRIFNFSILIPKFTFYCAIRDLKTPEI